MKKKKLIIFGFILTSMLAVGVVFAAFIFQRVVDFNAETGNITLTNKCFIDYSTTTEDGIHGEGRVDYTNAGKITEMNSVICYATEKKGYKDEENYFYLNQLGFEFSFTNTIDVYVRIHIQDSWISRKVYNNGNIVENYITKDKVEGKSPFDVTNEEWKYDENTNCAYLKEVVSPSENLEGSSYRFNIDSDYTYTSSAKTNAYREQILVQISFIVDIVQANRAQKKWNVDLNSFIGGNE